MVPREAAKGPCMLLTVLNSGSGMSFIGKNGLRHMQEAWPDVQVASPYASNVTSLWCF